MKRIHFHCITLFTIVKVAKKKRFAVLIVS